MSFTLNYTGDEINAILARANNGGEIDDELALKAPLTSPALTGNPTAPTQPEEDNSTKIATTEYADRAADAAGAAAEAAAKEYTDEATSALYITDTASGSIASFSDGADGIPMRSVKAQIEPVQDLHGYDAPWPAGGGKNLVGLNSSPNGAISYVHTTASEHSDNSVKLTSDGSAYAHMKLYYRIPAGTYTIKYQVEILTSGLSPVVTVYNTQNQVLAGSIPANTARTLTLSEETAVHIDFFVTQATGQVGTVRFYDFQLEKGSTATSYAPYSNECPISGWTGAEVTRTGVNVWDEETELGGFDADGNKTNVTNQLRTKNPIMVIPGKSYYASHATRYRFYDRNDVQFSSTLISAGGEITVPEGTAYMLFGLGLGYGTTYNHDISINYPSSDHDYHAYAGQTFPVTWESQAGEVFGGTIDVVSGVLTVTHKTYVVTSLVRSNATAYYHNPIGVSFEANYYETLSDKAPTATPDHLVGVFINQNKSIRLKTTTPYDSADDCIAAYGGALTVCAKLATPITYQLTPQQITSLLGQNNVWSNTGDVEVKYVADPKLYIAKITGGGTLTLGSVSPLSVNRPVTISEEDLEQAGEVSEAVEAAAETVLPAESGETEAGAQE